MKETVVGALREEISGNGLTPSKTETEKSIIEIIGYGHMVDHEHQIKIDSISIMGDLKFKSLEQYRFKLYSKKECSNIFFEKQDQIFSLKHQRLPIVSLEKILSKIYWENTNVWDNSFLQKIELKKTHIVGVVLDDVGKKCFLTFLVGDLHKKRIILRSETDMTEYLFPDNYLILNIENTTTREN
jgi:hypothetical protein